MTDLSSRTRKDTEACSVLGDLFGKLLSDGRKGKRGTIRQKRKNRSIVLVTASTSLYPDTSSKSNVSSKIRARKEDSFEIAAALHLVPYPSPLFDESSFEFEPSILIVKSFHRILHCIHTKCHIVGTINIIKDCRSALQDIELYVQSLVHRT